KEADYETNMVSGKYKDSGLGQPTRKVLGTKQYGVADFAPYAPSNGDPAAFIAQPYIRDGEIELIVALRLSLEAINSVMQQRDGMGETGETYLVGSDKLMRSDSFLDPEGHSVMASFAGTVTNNGVDSEAVNEALAGKTDSKIITDYKGNPVLSAYAPLKVGDTTWALLAEIDAAEAFAAIGNLYGYMTIIAVIVIIVIIILALVVARTILKPLGGEPEVMQRITEQISQGDLTVTFADAENATGVYAAMHGMTERLRELVGRVVHSSTVLANTAEQTSAIAEQTSTGIRNQHDATDQVATAMEEMSVTVQEVARNAADTASYTHAAEQQTEHGKDVVSTTVDTINGLATEINRATEVINSLQEKSTDIGSVSDVISGIADQTNLLALNAAIEAARAGEQGRGFAVVADEVRTLAQKTQESTHSIKEIIEQLQSGASEAVRVMEESRERTLETIDKAANAGTALESISQAVGRINGMNTQIATASEQQATVSEDISRNVQNISQIAAQTLTGAGETVAASAQLAELAKQLKGTVSTFRI
ncbi:MAG: methyl-accepting chemotaxis protein, partial [Gammaproteobacteria bacterium]|nr:methyl-accepting chemotaxis protein [Gammaproteobacteria bacterium]